MSVKNILFVSSLIILNASLITAQIRPIGLQSQKIVSLSISKSEVHPARALVAATADSGIYFYYLGMDCGWQNIGVACTDLSSIYVQVTGNGPADFYRVFAGRTASLRDTILIYSKDILDGQDWHKADSGLSFSEYRSIQDIDGFDYSGHEPPQPVFCLSWSDLFIYQNVFWEFCWFDPNIIVNPNFVKAVQSDLIYIGGSSATESALLHKSIDGGKEWMPVQINLLIAEWNGCFDIAVDVKRPDTLFLALGDNIIKSYDGGINWRQTALSEMQASFLGLEMNPANSNHIICYSRYDTSLIYESFDGGDNWDIVPNPFPSFKINEINAAVIEGRFTVFFATDNGIYSYETEPLSVDNCNSYAQPTHFSLEQNYPNPFNPITTISYSLKGPLSGRLSAVSQVKLTVFNVLGQKVATLVNEKQQTGFYSYKWNASAFANGVYFYRIQAGNLIQVRKMILMK